ncbi:MAG: membrane protein insertion efficiency factor YidD [Alphaproteobacteria bacterium]|nr:membrane protein insertion efficiency factor YidD [Alphaproteobacteria bacterium]
MKYIIILPAILLLQFYRFILSPILHFMSAQGVITGCRFFPSCSQYAVESIDRFGLYQGSILTLKRLMRCHPFAQAGYDPVPQSLNLNQISQKKRKR